MARLSRRAVCLGLGATTLAACGAPENGRPTLVDAPVTTTTFPRFGQVLRGPAESDPLESDAIAEADETVDRSIVAQIGNPSDQT